MANRKRDIPQVKRIKPPLTSDSDEFYLRCGVPDGLRISPADASKPACEQDAIKGPQAPHNRGGKMKKGRCY